MQKNNYKGNPLPFETEQEARQYAALMYGDFELAILYSPHATNAHGDYFIDEPVTIIRRWERLIFEGRGRDAN